MADISALQIAYQTWRLLQEGDDPDARLPGINLNARQLFFLNAAQVHLSGLIQELYHESNITNFHFKLLSIFALTVLDSLMSFMTCILRRILLG
jgi:hypothetical protein